jgi:hypothetical protein
MGLQSPERKCWSAILRCRGAQFLVRQECSSSGQAASQPIWRLPCLCRLVEAVLPSYMQPLVAMDPIDSHWPKPGLHDSLTRRGPVAAKAALFLALLGQAKKRARSAVRWRGRNEPATNAFDARLAVIASRSPFRPYWDDTIFTGELLLLPSSFHHETFAPLGKVHFRPHRTQLRSFAIVGCSLNRSRFRYEESVK